MTDPLDDQYIEWIYALVGRQEDEDHFRLLCKMHQTPFVPVVAMDSNRAADGVALRGDFRRGSSQLVDRHWLTMDCSVLEMLVGVARHLAFEVDGSVGEWFWHLIDNLSLARYDDRRYRDNIVEEILERLVWRLYSYDGRGGMFPLRTPYQDQRTLEIWLQKEAYVLEMD